MLVETDMLKLAPEMIHRILDTKLSTNEAIRTKVLNLGREVWEKIKIDFGIVFSKYTENVYEKYHKIKTILYKTEPKYIYDFFEYPFLEKERGAKIYAEHIEDLLKISHFLLVQGSGGLGKSTLLKHFLIDTMSKNLLIPIFVELKNVNLIKGDYDICDFIFEKLSDLGSTISKDHIDYALKSGCFLFLFDGYDEINTKKRADFFIKLDSFCDRYFNNYFIISTRPFEEFIDFQRFTILKLLKFNKKQAMSLIYKLEFDKEVKDRFILALDKELYDTHISFASNPLLLIIMLLTFENYAEIPKKLHLLYEQSFETMYYRHDATKAGFQREMRSGLTYDLFKKIFSTFCFVTYYQNKFEFNQGELRDILKKIGKRIKSFDVDNYIYDLVNCVCVLYMDGHCYVFAHRSYQEYFTAFFLKELTDDQFKDIGIQLIKKDIHRAVHDKVFIMLYDMTEERMERNILLPILNEIECDCDSDKYKFYLDFFHPCFGFIVHDNEVGSIYCKIGGISSNIIDFILNFSWFYSSPTVNDSSKFYYDDTIMIFLEDFEYTKYKDKEQLKAYVNGKEVFDLFKKTIFGEQIDIISQLSNILKQKQKTEELDLNILLQGELLD